jgi:hypothetical protein
MCGLVHTLHAAAPAAADRFDEYRIPHTFGQRARAFIRVDRAAWCCRYVRSTRKLARAELVADSAYL